MHSKGNVIVGDGASALQMKRPARAPPSDEHLLASPTAVAARARVEAGRRSGSVVEEEVGTLALQCRRRDRAAAKEGGTSGKWGPDLVEPELAHLHQQQRRRGRRGVGGQEHRGDIEAAEVCAAPSSIQAKFRRSLVLDEAPAHKKVPLLHLSLIPC